jgi:spore germination protein GerM
MPDVAVPRSSKKRVYYPNDTRNTASQQRSYKVPPRRKRFGVLIFWMVFFAVVVFFFLINEERIRTTMRDAHFPTWFLRKPKIEQPLPEEALPGITPGAGESVFAEEAVSPEGLASPEADVSSLKDDASGEPAEDTVSAEGETPVDNRASVEAETPVDDRAPIAGTAPIADTAPIVGTAHSEAPPAGENTPRGTSASGGNAVLPGGPASSVAVLPPASPPATPQMRNGFLYFVQLDRGGTILRSRLGRAVPSTNSPLQDTLRALVKGPTQTEQNQGFKSLIPEGTSILSVTLRGETAYINVSENFLYNTYGVEGYANSLAQLVWTATEFSNVNNVQLLIDGRRLDFLGENIWIGSPLDRESM